MRENLIDDNVKVNNIVNRQEHNKSAYFILPMIGLDYTYFALINSYLGDMINQPDNMYKRIYINVKYFDEKIRGIEYYVSEYKLEDKTWMYEFRIPAIFEKDYLLFTEGKYSEFSDRYKSQIIRLVKIRPVQNSSVYKVLYKTSDRKAYIEDLIGQSIGDQEVCSRPDLSLEVYSEGDKIATGEKVQRDISN